MSDPHDMDDDDDLRAAEYVLHLLEPEERAAVEARVATDGALSELVRDWTERLADLDPGFPVIAPPDHVKEAIWQRLFDPDDVVDPAPGQGAFGWLLRILSGAAVAAALALAVFLLVPLQEGPRIAPALTATIAAQDGSLVIAASASADMGSLAITRSAGEAPAGRVLELWAIPGDGVPVSLGVLPPEATASVAVPAELQAGLAALTLAISEEPPGGSPTGQPTGAVLAAGVFAAN